MIALCRVAADIVRRSLRGPIVGVAILGFALVFAVMPRSGLAPGVERLRAAAGGSIAILSVLVTVLALALPLGSVAWLRGRTPGGAFGPRGRLLAAFLGHALTTLFIAVVLGSAALLGLVVREGYREGVARSDALREVVLEGPPEPAIALPGGPSVLIGLGDAASIAGGTDHLLRIRANLRVDPRPGSPALGSLDARVDLRLLAGEQVVLERSGLVLRGSRTLSLPFASFRSAALTGPMSLDLTCRARGVLVEVEPGSITISGRARPLATSLLRAAFGRGLAALVPLLFCLWLSGFVSYPIAVAATLTALLASAVWPEALTLVPDADQGSAIVRGDVVGFRTFVGPAVAALALLGAVLLVPRPVPPSPGDEG